MVDAGVKDKRLLVIEPEFAQVLRQTQRDGNTLSPVIRQAWDSGNLKTLTRNDPITATDAHVSLLGHITSEELAKLLSANDTANGFANRFLWVLVKRSKLLPDGGRELDLSDLQLQLRKAIASVSGRMVRSAEASALWHKLYPMLTADRSGRYGMATSRAEAQTLRLSMIYAVLDGTTTIEAQHLRAAYAVWCYCQESARQIFGEGESLSPLERKLLQSIQRKHGATRTELHKAVGGHIKAQVLVDALGVLQSRGLIFALGETSGDKGGRPCERWYPLEQRNEPTPSECESPCEETKKPINSEGEKVSSLVRNEPEQKAEAEPEAEPEAQPLDLKGLFAEVNRMQGKIVRKGESYTIAVDNSECLLSPVLKASLDAHADALALLLPKLGQQHDAQPIEENRPAEPLTEWERQEQEEEKASLAQWERDLMAIGVR